MSLTASAAFFSVILFIFMCLELTYSSQQKENTHLSTAGSMRKEKPLFVARFFFGAADLRSHQLIWDRGC